MTQNNKYIEEQIWRLKFTEQVEIVKKKQKTFSLPQAVDQELEEFLTENKDMLGKMGVTNKTQLLVAIYRNGKPRYESILEKFKEAENS